jgi:hypothetical protein
MQKEALAWKNHRSQTPAVNREDVDPPRRRPDDCLSGGSEREQDRNQGAVDSCSVEGRQHPDEHRARQGKRQGRSPRHNVDVKKAFAVFA